MAISTGGLYTCTRENKEEISFFFSEQTKVQMQSTTCHHNSIKISEVEFFEIFGLQQYFLSENFLLFSVSMYYWFRVTYYTKFIGCIFGIVRFLDLGPTRILSKHFWTNIFGYLLASFSVGQSLHTKALGLGTGGVILEIVLSAIGLCNNSGIVCIDQKIHKTMWHIK